MSKIFITNIISDTLKTNGKPEITNLKLHELICDRQIEGGTLERQVTSILDFNEYQSVISNGFYTVNDEKDSPLSVDSPFNEKEYENGKIIQIGYPKRY
ncbi:hypothetical protein [Eubacterium oxidoreducens]|uniref:Uncharacterized protein n=1 Tax=Eubacterium oxidoreducens TaxID=1732 RepID=A0A1G6B1J1_EUBOX|nr:hypothetical protein [Eubacterium oxidoreducens]SDB14550.1 hypothetical protein SAMN02910417_01056 [Eubacterium oxidoreducens]